MCTALRPQGCVLGMIVSCCAAACVCPLVQVLPMIASPRSDEYMDMANRITYGTAVSPQFTGSKHFFRCDAAPRSCPRLLSPPPPLPSHSPPRLFHRVGAAGAVSAVCACACARAVRLVKSKGRTYVSCTCVVRVCVPPPPPCRLLGGGWQV